MSERKDAGAPGVPEEPDDPREAIRLLVAGFREFLTRLDARLDKFKERIDALYARLEELERDPDV